MNDVATALYTAINNQISVDKNGVDTEIRLYFGVAPQNTKYPYITYMPTDESPIHFHDDDPLSETNWDFKIWGSDVLEIGEIFEGLVDIFNSDGLDTDFVGALSSTGFPMIVENNEPNNIVYSRIVECEVYIDATLPAAPSVAIATTSTTATLTWVAPFGRGSPITGYEVSSDDGSTWTSKDSTATSHEFDNLIEDTEYTFQVRAVNSSGTGVAAVIVQKVGVPTAPRELIAMAQPDGTSADLSWTVPSDDGDSDITDYEYSSDGGSSFTAIGTDTSYTVTGLDKGTAYNFQVRAVNSVGNGTATSSVPETTETTVPDAPTSFSVDSIETTSATLSWAGPADTGGASITNYEYSTDDGSTWTSTDSTELSYRVEGLTSETDYMFRVRAVNSQGSGMASESVEETTN